MNEHCCGDCKHGIPAVMCRFDGVYVDALDDGEGKLNCNFEPRDDSTYERYKKLLSVSKELALRSKDLIDECNTPSGCCSFHTLKALENTTAYSISVLKGFGVEI